MIYFIGGGVGTADYLTVLAFRILQKADVVLYSKYLDSSVLGVCKKRLCEKICFSGMARNDVDALFSLYQVYVLIILICYFNLN